MSETETKKADKEAAIAKLSTQIDANNAKSAKLKEEVATLQSELANLARAQAEMDKLRAEERSVSNGVDAWLRQFAIVVHFSGIC